MKFNEDDLNLIAKALGEMAKMPAYRESYAGLIEEVLDKVNNIYFDDVKADIGVRFKFEQMPDAIEILTLGYIDGELYYYDKVNKIVYSEKGLIRLWNTLIGHRDEDGRVFLCS